MKTTMPIEATLITLMNGIVVCGFHLTNVVNLTDLWNQAKIKAHRPSAVQKQWLDSKRTREFIEETALLTGKTIEELVFIKGRGKKQATWVHINIAISAMSYLSPKIEAQITHEFVTNRLFQWRDQGGDEFIDLNFILSSVALEVLGKEAHKGHFINLAKIIKKKVGADNWVTATALQHSQRAEWEKALSTMLRAGVVRDWDHLKDLAEIV
jgi:hypothetical protein